MVVLGPFQPFFFFFFFFKVEVDGRLRTIELGPKVCVGRRVR